MLQNILTCQINPPFTDNINLLETHLRTLTGLKYQAQDLRIFYIKLYESY